MKNLKEKSIANPKTVWPIFFRKNINDGLSRTKIGSRVEFMVLIIFYGNRFHQKGPYALKKSEGAKSLRLHPKKSNHKKHFHKLCGE